MKRIWLMGIILVLAAGCGDDKMPAVPCDVNADCQSHELCFDGYCEAVKCPEPPEKYQGYAISPMMCEDNLVEGNTSFFCCPYIGEDCYILLCCNQKEPGSGYYKFSEKCD